MRIDPLEPPEDVPDKNAKSPLTPSAPEFDVRIIMLPLEDAVPRPESMDI
jgi:hypothetical protein